MPINERNLEAVIAAILAVNSYGLEKSYKLLPSLRKAGLTDPATVAKADDRNAKSAASTWCGLRSTRAPEKDRDRFSMLSEEDFKVSS